MGIFLISRVPMLEIRTNPFALAMIPMSANNVRRAIANKKPVVAQVLFSATSEALSKL